MENEKKRQFIRDLLHLKRHEQQQKVIYRIIFKNPALISRPGKGFRHIEKESAGEFEVVELYKRLLNFNNLSVFRSEMSTSLTVSLFLCHRRFSMSSLEYINSIIVQLT